MKTRKDSIISVIMTDEGRIRIERWTLRNVSSVELIDELQRIILYAKTRINIKKQL